MSSNNNNTNSQDSQSFNPIQKIEAEQLHMAALCDRLETFANGLPDDLSSFTFESIASELRTKLPRLHYNMEKVLFPALKKRALPEDRIDEIIAGFTHEHAMDDGYVLGVLEVLDRFAKGPLASNQKAENYDAVGYQLRGFFESLRRHLRWERFIVLQLARQRLSDEDLVEINNQMSSRGS